MATVFSKHDAGGGGIGTFADPFTLQELVDNVDGNATALGLVCATGNYTPSVTIDFDTNAGTMLLPNTIRGANADGSDDGTVATISGSSLGAGDDLFDIGIITYLTLENLRITAATRYNIYNDQNARVIFKTCQIDNAISHGYYHTSTLTDTHFYNTEINNNGGDGTSVNANARGNFKFFRCSIHDNVNHGIHDGASSTTTAFPEIIDSIIYDNGGDGANYRGVANYSGPIIRGSIFFGNTGNGIDLSLDRGRVIIENCIGRSNGGYFIDTNTGTVNQFLSCKNNCSHNNTSGHIDINSNVLPGTGHIYQDPLFVSETDGSEDFNLQSGSPCLAAGIDAGIW